MSHIDQKKIFSVNNVGIGMNITDNRHILNESTHLCLELVTGQASCKCFKSGCGQDNDVIVDVLEHS